MILSSKISTFLLFTDFCNSFFTPWHVYKWIWGNNQNRSIISLENLDAPNKSRFSDEMIGLVSCIQSMQFLSGKGTSLKLTLISNKTYVSVVPIVCLIPVSCYLLPVASKLCLNLSKTQQIVFRLILVNHGLYGSTSCCISQWPK